MMALETLRVDEDARGVATLTLARPDKHNALSAEMIAELHQVAQFLGASASIRLVVLRAEGKSFCAGGDLAWMRAQFGASRAERISEATKLAHMLKALNLLPKPLIARVHGPAYGGGIGLLSVCDAAFGLAGARFGFTEARLGLIPATISPYVLARMGEGRARRVFMSARLIEAAEAQSLGLLSEIFEGEAALDARIEAEIACYLNAAPGAVADSKALARSLGPAIDDEVIAGTIERLADCWEGAEAQAGIAAFFARQKPEWIKDQDD